MRMTGSLALSQDMKRMPVVIAESGVFGVTLRIREIRSHGFSWYHFTPTERLVELVKSIASKPTRSRWGPTASTMPVVSPVAPHKLWLPSRKLVSTRRIGWRGDVIERTPCVVRFGVPRWGRTTKW